LENKFSKLPKKYLEMLHFATGYDTIQIMGQNAQKTYNLERKKS